MKLKARRHEIPDDPEAWLDFVMERGWGDGLPIIPPTEERVAEMVARSGRPADESLGRIPHLFGEATIEKIAVNAVMAGCRPEYVPVLLGAVEAVFDPAYNLPACQSTTNCVAQLIIVHGPARAALGVNCAENLFGQGWRANAAIGRAFRFVLQNIGGAKPPDTDRSTFGHPGKFTSCIGENEEAAPWPPLHVERGLARTDSAVTVMAIDPIIMVNDATSTTGENVLHSIAYVLIQAGSNNARIAGEPLVVLGPEHVDILVRDGWDRPRIRAYLYDNARVPLSFFSPENLQRVHQGRAAYFAEMGAVDYVTMATDPDHIALLVAGGLGKHSLVVPTFGNTKSVTRRIGL